jgi:hypothetical protein
MRWILPSITVIGIFVFGAAGLQAYGPSPGSGAAIKANEPA